MKDETNLAHERTLPGLLAPALGIEIEEYESFDLGITDNEATEYSIKADDELGGTHQAVHYADWIKAKGAQAMARYDEPHLKPFAAVTRNEFGDGVGWYVGAIVGEPVFYDRLIAKLLEDEKIRALSPPAGVEAVIRSNQNRELLFLINHNREKITMRVPEGGRECLTDSTIHENISLDPFDVAVIDVQSPRE